MHTNVEFTDGVSGILHSVHHSAVQCDSVFVVAFFKAMYNETIIRFGFCDIQNNQLQGKCYQPQPSAFADSTYLTLDYSRYC